MKEEVYFKISLERQAHCCLIKSRGIFAWKAVPAPHPLRKLCQEYKEGSWFKCVRSVRTECVRKDWVTMGCGAGKEGGKTRSG